MDHYNNGGMPGLAAPASGDFDCMAPVGAAGDAPVPLTPKRETASGEAGRIEEQRKHDSIYFLTEKARGKEFSRIRESLAQSGYALIETTAGLYIVPMRGGAR